MPHMCCDVTASTALAAMAASTALPPACSMATPALDGEVVDRAHHAGGRVAGDERCDRGHRGASLGLPAWMRPSAFAQIVARPAFAARRGRAGARRPRVSGPRHRRRAGPARRAGRRVKEPTRVRAAPGALSASLALRGNAEDYYNPDNSFLNRVLDTGLGIPISLAVVMIEVGRRAGVAAWWASTRRPTSSSGTRRRRAARSVQQRRRDAAHRRARRRAAHDRRPHAQQPAIDLRQPRRASTTCSGSSGSARCCPAPSLDRPTNSNAPWPS